MVKMATIIMPKLSTVIGSTNISHEGKNIEQKITFADVCHPFLRNGQYVFKCLFKNVDSEKKPTCGAHTSTVVVQSSGKWFEIPILSPDTDCFHVNEDVIIPLMINYFKTHFLGILNTICGDFRDSDKFGYSMTNMMILSKNIGTHWNIDAWRNIAINVQNKGLLD